MGVTFHYITDQWEYRQFPVGFRHLLGAHTAQNVGEFVADVLTPFLGILFAVT